MLDNQQSSFCRLCSALRRRSLPSPSLLQSGVANQSQTSAVCRGPNLLLTRVVVVPTPPDPHNPTNPSPNLCWPDLQPAPGPTEDTSSDHGKHSKVRANYIPCAWGIQCCKATYVNIELVCQWIIFCKILDQDIKSNIYWNTNTSIKIIITTSGTQHQCKSLACTTRCRIWRTIELHRDPILKVLSEW